MRTAFGNEAVPTRHVVRAALLLVGLLGVGHGYFSDSVFFLFGGALLIVAIVLSSVVEMLTWTGRHGSQ